MHLFLSNFLITNNQVTTVSPLPVDVESSHLPVPGPHPSSTKAVKVAFLRHKCEDVAPCFTLSDGFHCSREERQVPNLTYNSHSLLHLPSHARFASLCPSHGASVASAFSPSIVPCSSLPQGLGTSCVLCEESSYFPSSLSPIYLLLILQILGRRPLSYRTLFYILVQLLLHICLPLASIFLSSIFSAYNYMFICAVAVYFPIRL